MRSILLALIAVLDLGVGLWRLDSMAILIGVAAALGALVSRPKYPLATFLRVMSELFAVETLLFGLADLVRLLGYWPEAFKDYALARYLPLATAVFVIVLTLIYRFELVRKMMGIADPFFEAKTPIRLKPLLLPRFTMRQSWYASGCVMLLILINQAQVALSVRLNFFQNDFGNAIQVPDEAHRVEFWHQLIDVFLPLAFIIIASNVIEYFIAANFVIQWRRWMTASYTSRWLLNSMHYKLALASDSADNPDQRISQDIGGFINGSGTGSNSGNAGIYNYTIQIIASATNLVSFSIILWTISSAMNVPYLNIEIPGFLFWVATIYAALATGATHMIGARLSRLFFRQQAVEANFRFDLARVREYSEQIALLKGETRETERAAYVFEEVFVTLQRIIRVRTLLTIFTQFYLQISIIIPYVVVAPFYYAKKVTFGVFNQAADAFGSVNGAMNFFIDRYVGLADFKATVDRLTTFDEAFARVLATHRETEVEVKPNIGAALAIPELELNLPDGRKLARIGNLMLVPQQSTLVFGPSGAGKSTLFRAIAGLWPYGKGEILQPAYAKLMLLPQRPYLPLGPLRYALTYPTHASEFSDADLKAVLAKVGLPALVDKLDEEENWQMRLSGGEQQRLAVARALLAKPDWLFLDEATASLDEESESNLYRAIVEALPNATLVSIGHRSTLAQFHKRRLTVETHPSEPATVTG